MKYLYSLADGLLVSIGIVLVTRDMRILGIVAICIGAICLLASSFGGKRRRGRLAPFILSCVAIILVCAFAGNNVLASAKDEAVNFVKQHIGTSSPQGASTSGDIIASGSNFRVTMGLPVQGYFYKLAVDVTPNKKAIANTVYKVDLYEKGQLRNTTQIEWNPPEINVLGTKMVVFPITDEEFTAYQNKDVNHIFIVKVHK